tara:strand:- start:56 stop:607 length:552 start_codon:yes stop_codon:yes gene_type:complete
MKTPVDSPKKILAVSNLSEKASKSDDQICIYVIDKRLDKNIKVHTKSLGKFAEKIVRDVAPDKRPLEMNLFLLETGEISILNEKHLSKKGPTDVLAFPIDDPNSETDSTIYLMGDVCICPEVATEQAKEKDLKFEDEMILLLTHGILHLLGYDHDEEAAEKEMKEMEKILIDRHAEESRGSDA